VQRWARHHRETVGEHRLVHVRRATEVGMPRIEAEVLDTSVRLISEQIHLVRRR
jgi:hypothetical protein